MAVSSKKDKLLEEAQKFSLRGQFDKAVKAYEQILALEPSAISQRQKLGELLVKCGRNDDARKEFDTIGKHYSKNGFFLKAIAVYKQLQKLFPDDITLSLTLAELNGKHGLIANSLSEYKLVYEFYEKAGNISDSLAILDRMQNVDPNSIPIKIKLAEAYIQNGKRSESYSVFAKVLSILIERGDESTIAKICTRVTQLFPEKPEFLLEILTEQLRSGNASTVIPTLQNLLRGNPQNKRVWEIIIEAYELLDQPKRVKMACQHYLKFFPSEPAAMIGVILTTVAELNIVESLKLLDQYETTLISAGFFQKLQQAYKILEKIEPINIRIIEGLLRVATAADDEAGRLLYSGKLESMKSLSTPTNLLVSEETVFSSVVTEGKPALPGSDEPAIPAKSEESFYDSNQSSVFEDSKSEPSAETSFEVLADSDVEDIQLGSDEEIEIDIDIDLDSPFAPLDQAVEVLPVQENWLDSVSNLFDTISTTPTGVKFSSEMESADAQSHFDLGQAFKEMGLYDEAINEFRNASQDPSRMIECMVMQCACLRERGEAETAITMLQALMKSELSLEESSAVKYELATGYEAIGKGEEARTLLNAIDAVNPGFRDISSRLNAANLSESLDFSDDDFKDF